jgi:hypothetical protein
VLRAHEGQWLRAAWVLANSRMLGTGRASPGGQRPRPRPPTSSMSILIQQQRVPNKSVPWGFRRATWPRGRRKGAVGFGRVGAWRVVVKRLEAREREPSGIKHSASWDGRCHPPPRPRAVRCGLTSGVPNGASRQHRKTDPHMETVWSSPRNVAGWPQRTQSSPGGSGPDSDRTTARQHDSTTATTTPVRESPTKKSVPQTRSRNEAATPIICMHNRARLVQVASAVVGACCWTEHFTRATPPFLASVLHERKTTMPPLGYFAYHAAKHGRQSGTAVDSRRHCGRSPSKCLLWVCPRLRLPRSTIRSNSGFVSPANDTEHDVPKP